MRLQILLFVRRGLAGRKQIVCEELNYGREIHVYTLAATDIEHSAVYCISQLQSMPEVDISCKSVESFL
jgi:hypothetical protein